MEYIIVFDPDQKNACLLESNDNFLMVYSTYEDAKADGELWKRSGDCKSYSIYANCNEQINNVVQKITVHIGNATECKDCGYVCKEEDLINKTGKHSKDEILCCPKCESRDVKFY